MTRIISRFTIHTLKFFADLYSVFIGIVEGWPGKTAGIFLNRVKTFISVLSPWTGSAFQLLYFDSVQERNIHSVNGTEDTAKSRTAPPRWNMQRESANIRFHLSPSIIVIKHVLHILHFIARDHRSRMKSLAKLIIHGIAKLLRPIKLDSFIRFCVIQFRYPTHVPHAFFRKIALR